MAKAPVRKKLAPKRRINVRLRPELLEMLHMGAAYHGVAYQTYLQWLLAQGVRQEAAYYGWVMPDKKYVLREKKELTDFQTKTLRRMLSRVGRKLGEE